MNDKANERSFHCFGNSGFSGFVPIATDRMEVQSGIEFGVITVTIKPIEWIPISELKVYEKYWDDLGLWRWRLLFWGKRLVKAPAGWMRFGRLVHRARIGEHTFGLDDVD